MKALRPLGIRAHGGLIAPLNGTLPDELDPLVEQLLGRRLRKVGRFIKLSLCGALSALRDPLLPSGSRERVGVFLATGLGNLLDLISFSEAALGGGQSFPSPTQFANSLGNSAAFYVAQALEISGPVLAVSQDELSFEAAVINAWALLEANEIDLALVGGVDIDCPAAEDQRTRMGFEPEGDVTPGEGSAWLVLERASAGSTAIIEDVRLGNRELWKSNDLPSDTALCLNTRLSRAEPALRTAAMRAPKWGAFLTESAASVCDFLDDSGSAPMLLCLGRARDGSSGLIRIRKTGASAR